MYAVTVASAKNGSTRKISESQKSVSNGRFLEVAMEEREEGTVFTIWVDWKNKVISFSKENGFEELRFSTHEEKFKFAIDRGNEGFGIQ